MNELTKWIESLKSGEPFAFNQYDIIEAVEGVLAERDALREDKTRLVEALDRIARPVWWMQEDQKRKTGSINGINGGMAITLSESHGYLKGIAQAAIDAAKGGSGE